MKHNVSFFSTLLCYHHESYPRHGRHGRPLHDLLYSALDSASLRTDGIERPDPVAAAVAVSLPRRVLERGRGRRGLSAEAASSLLRRPTECLTSAPFFFFMIDVFTSAISLVPGPSLPRQEERFSPSRCENGLDRCRRPSSFPPPASLSGIFYQLVHEVAVAYLRVVWD